MLQRANVVRHAHRAPRGAVSKRVDERSRSSGGRSSIKTSVYDKAADVPPDASNGSQNLRSRLIAGRDYTASTLNLFLGFFWIIAARLFHDFAARLALVCAVLLLNAHGLAARASSDGFLEEVTLDFSRIRWEHRTQLPDGRVGATTTGGWDVRTNRKL